MYGITKETQADQAGLYFGGGITENVEIEKVAYEGSKKDGSGDKVLAFHFKGKNGEQFRHVEWAVDTTRDDAAKKFESLSKRVKHILSKFLGEGDIIITGVSTFEEFANKVVTISGSKFSGIKLRIKLVYNEKGNLGFTKYLGFVERMDTVPSKMQVGANEVVVRPTPAPTSQATLESGTDDLPF